MALPSVPDPGEDPTMQIPWPKSRYRSPEGSRADTGEQHPAQGSTANPEEPPEPVVPAGTTTGQLLSTWNLITLSISMAGAQIAWTVELGYGTPFLLQLGLSEQLTSLVWLAGPISGLIAQPLIGAISDSSPSKYRRRYWIVTSTVFLVCATLALAYCEPIAAFVVDLFGGGVGDWDPKRKKLVVNTAIGFAIVSFYILDFALNALQASLRNLLLDITPPSQLNSGNAWHGRMTHAGNIVGFGFGFLPLANLPLLRLLGGDQFRKFCVVSMVILVATVWITCFCHEEKEQLNAYRKRSKLRVILENIFNTILNLPKPIRRVCFVQLFAFMGWFPFLFYSTTYIGQVMAYEHNAEPDPTLAIRKGEFAMLLYSLVSVCAGIVLPHLAVRDRRLMPAKTDVTEDAELTRLKHLVRLWKAEAARQGKPLRLPVMPFLLRNIWTGALLLFTLLTLSTFFITTVAQATVMISLVGVCWAVACWVPFAIIMECLKELDSPRKHTDHPAYGTSPFRPAGGVHSRTISSASMVIRDGNSERHPLIRQRRLSFDEQDMKDEQKKPIAGGTVLGIHNLAIVMPQFIIAIASSVIFRVVDGVGSEDDKYLGKHGVGWVLRFGGLCTLIGAIFARMVSPTPTEREMRRRLGEMRELERDSGP